ncbi:MAG TPA: SDR family oxidoreductase [Acidimicrobiia bacterium]|nr:SDR family oxidoreductase [Acidimicrobiia bacterium]
MKGTVVVTGAARGIGRVIAETLLNTGPFTVVGVDIAPELALTDGIVPVQVDLTAGDGPAAVRAAVEDTGVPLLGVVNNAGITRDARLVNMTDEDFSAVLDVNLGASYRLTEALAPLIIPGGAIVNIASRAYLGNFGQFNYSMSKGGLVGLTRALAIDLAPDIRANAIAPGLIASEMSMGIPDDIREKMIAAIPLDRMGTPQEIANAVFFLLSPQSSYITGHVLVVGGGRSLT